MNNDKRFSIQFGRLVAYHGNDQHVEIPSGVTVIGRRCFYSSGVRTVVIPETVTEIESEAFGFSDLQNAVIKGRILKIGADAFPYNEDLELCVLSSVPVRSFTKAARDQAVRSFIRRFAGLDPDTETFRDDILFIGAHLKRPEGYYRFLIENGALRHAVLAADAIPAKDLKWLITTLQDEGQAELTAELLDYQNRLLSDEKVEKSLEKAEARAAEKALSAEMTVADWRKLLKFTYEDGDVVIKEVRIREPVIELPDHIGNRRVRVIDSGAFAYYLKKGETVFWSPEKIIIPEGIEEIRSGAFDCAEDTEIFFPSTVKALPEHCFCYVQNLTLHIPASVTEIADELEIETPESAFKVIYAPAGSYAEQYAKEHNIPFEAE